MKSPLCSRNGGAALVVVLALLILLAILGLAFYVAVESDTKSSSANRNLGSLRQLSDLTRQIVETQIRAATTLGQTNSLAESVNTWTSQPGLLRVFNNSGGLVRVYKLYSSASMDTNDTAFLAAGAPADWGDHPNRWVNLNEPFRSVTQTDRLVWPILNPAATNWAEGLTVSVDTAGETNAAMPVEWLYVLADGTIIPQDQLVAANPPVGRVAFWTDDETCKINLNTAGERTMWDRPRSWHEKRAIYGNNQPSTGEYNAYPGHPATVSLSAVFGRALSGEPPEKIVEDMLALTPRYRWGGSENASRPIWDRAENWQAGSLLNLNKNERLYATPSELLLNVTRGLNDSRLETATAESGFLLTESSRAPEINVFGLPRVGIWPLDADPDKRTACDKLIARALTIGDKPYFFQRSNPLAAGEAESVPRNWDLLRYLDRLTQRPVNGFGNTFQAKWGQDERRQVLTQIFDYVRAATNLSDTSRSQADYGKQFTPATAARRGFVVPTRITTAGWNTRGLGRAPTLTHAAVVLYAYEQSETDPGPPQIFDTKVNAVLWFNFFSPMQGLAPYSVRYRVRLKSYNLAIKEPSAGGFQNFLLRGDTSDQFYFPRNNQDIDWGGYDGMPIHAGSSSLGGFSNYAFQSAAPITIEGNSLAFQGGPLELELIEDSSGEVLQTFTIDFPDSTAPWPIPLLWGGRWRADGSFDPDFYATTDGTGNVTNPFSPFAFSQREANPELMAEKGNYLLGHRAIGTSANPKPAVDVIRTMEIRDGDARLVSALNEVDASHFVPGYGYFDGGRRLTGSLLYGRTAPLPNDRFGSPAVQYGRHVETTFKIDHKTLEVPSLPGEVNGQQTVSLREANWTGDFDNGFLGEPDGPYANKPDEGHTRSEVEGVQLPYFTGQGSSIDGEVIRGWDPRLNGFFSPTRQVPSAVMFGSLPTGVKRTDEAYRDDQPDEGRPWETLLFAPNAQAAMVADADGNFGHPGAQAPHDHLLLDLFTMPVVEPYAISEPFSTAGKINLNQRIIPFTHIRRETALFGLLKNLEFSAMPSTSSPGINPAAYRSGASSVPSIRLINIPQTLREMAKVLDPGGQVGTGVFRSASQICEVFLVPEDKTEAGSVNWTTDNPQAFWAAHQLTGDNSREAPYNYLYPLLTTKSNSYQVHYRVQTLKALVKKAGFDPANDFVVTGEQRGSYVLERYLDVNDPRFLGETPEINSDTTPLNEFYQFRTIRHGRFTGGN